MNYDDAQHFCARLWLKRLLYLQCSDVNGEDQCQRWRWHTGDHAIVY